MPAQVPTPYQLRHHHPLHSAQPSIQAAAAAASSILPPRRCHLRLVQAPLLLEQQF
jgi:hypothetical protein